MYNTAKRSIKGLRVLVTGGAGYVGSSLVPKLLAECCQVTVLDKMIFGELLPEENSNLQVIRGDIRDISLLQKAVRNQNAVIHLAFISNDPEYELESSIGEAINWGAFPSLVTACQNVGVERFIFASSCSVYGDCLHNSDTEIDERVAPNPLTDYARLKVACERYLLESNHPGLCRVIVRPATLCGMAPRQRLDLTVNRMVTDAYHKGIIKIHNPARIRPSLHIDDMVRLYLELLKRPCSEVDSQIFNVAFENRTLAQLAQIVQEVVGNHVHIEEVLGNDRRSYKVSSSKLVKSLGFNPHFQVVDAVRTLHNAFSYGSIPDALTSKRYYNLLVQKHYDWKSESYT